MDWPLGAVFNNKAKGFCHLGSRVGHVSLPAREDKSVHKLSFVNNQLHYIMYLET